LLIRRNRHFLAAWLAFLNVCCFSLKLPEISASYQNTRRLAVDVSIALAMGLCGFPTPAPRISVNFQLASLPFLCPLLHVLGFSCIRVSLSFAEQTFGWVAWGTIVGRWEHAGDRFPNRLAPANPRQSVVNKAGSSVFFPAGCSSHKHQRQNMH